MKKRDFKEMMMAAFLGVLLIFTGCAVPDASMEVNSGKKKPAEVSLGTIGIVHEDPVTGEKIEETVEAVKGETKIFSRLDELKQWVTQNQAPLQYGLTRDQILGFTDWKQVEDAVNQYKQMKSSLMMNAIVWDYTWCRYTNDLKEGSYTVSGFAKNAIVLPDDMKELREIFKDYVNYEITIAEKSSVCVNEFYIDFGSEKILLSKEAVRVACYTDSNARFQFNGVESGAKLTFQLKLFGRIKWWEKGNNEENLLPLINYQGSNHSTETFEIHYNKDDCNFQIAPWWIQWVMSFFSIATSYKQLMGDARYGELMALYDRLRGTSDVTGFLSAVSDICLKIVQIQGEILTDNPGITLYDMGMWDYYNKGIVNATVTDLKLDMEDGVGECEVTLTPVNGGSSNYKRFYYGQLIHPYFPTPDASLTRTSTDGGVIFINVEPGEYLLEVKKLDDPDIAFEKVRIRAEKSTVTNACHPNGPKQISNGFYIEKNKYDSVCVSRVIPSPVNAGQTCEAVIEMKNSGTAAWDWKNFKLGSRSPDFNRYWGAETWSLAENETVLPGQTARFTVRITPEVNPGIYPAQWRMVRMEGTVPVWFGDTSDYSWIEVMSPVSTTTTTTTTVMSFNDAKVISAVYPTTMVTGQVYRVEIEMYNSGKKNWTAQDGYKLGSQNEQDNKRWGFSRVLLGAGESIAPGQTRKFVFNVTAPAPGTYPCQWKMVQEGVEWFGETSEFKTVSVQALSNNSSIESVQVPSEMIAGQTYAVSFTFRNTGNSIWTRSAGYQVYDRNSVWGIGQINLGDTEQIQPGQSKEFSFNVTAPAASGSYPFVWQMRQNGTGFGGYSCGYDQLIKVRTLINNAKVISAVYPATMVTGKVHTVAIEMQNVGETVWTLQDGYKLGSQNEADNKIWGFNRVLLGSGESIAPGQIRKFVFNVTAPAPGTYPCQWQMIREPGVWFGETNAFQEVTVEALTNNASIESVQVPSEMIAGQTYAVSFTFRNTGNTVWSKSAGYQIYDRDGVWGIGQINLGDTEQIYPGQSKEFSFSVTAPAAPGKYPFVWQMRQNGNAFGPYSSGYDKLITVRKLTSNSRVISAGYPTTMVEGKVYSVTIEMQNTGDTAWTESQGYRLGSQNTADNRIWGFNRVFLGAGESIAPGQTRRFVFNVTAPAAGYYPCQWKMIQEGVEWFGETNAFQGVTVKAKASCESVLKGETYNYYDGVNRYGYQVRAYRVKNASAVKFATWTTAGGQNDLIWQTPSYVADQDYWVIPVETRDHQEERGEYITHVYAVDETSGDYVFLGEIKGTL